MSTENRRSDNMAANHGELPVEEQDLHASHVATLMAGTYAAMRPARVRPFAPPATWQVVTGQLMRPPWRLSSAAWRGLTQAVWDGSQWYAVARTADRLTVEAGGYFAWCQTNRALVGAQNVSNWPPAAQFWLRHYAWTDPPQVPSPLARIALTTGGWVRDRFGRYLAVQAPGRADWTGSAGGGITPEDGYGPAVPERAWRREVHEELGIDLETVQSLGTVADPRTDAWCWLFMGTWDGDWAAEPWHQAVDSVLEVHRVTLITWQSSPPPLSPVAAWGWQQLTGTA